MCALREHPRSDQRTAAAAGLVERALSRVAYLAGRVVELAGPAEAHAAVVASGELGEAVLFEPALRSLAGRFGGRVHLWAPPRVCELFDAAPFVAQLVRTPGCDELAGMDWLNRLLARLSTGYATGRWRYAVVLRPSTAAGGSPSDAAFAALRANERWVVSGAPRDVADAATRVLSADLDEGHQLERNARLARQWDGDVGMDLPIVHRSDAAMQVAYSIIRQWRSEAGRLGAGTVIGIVPDGTADVRTYPPASWARVIDTLWHRHRMMPAFLGTPAEQRAIDQIAALLPGVPFLRLVGELSALELASVIAKLDMVIGVDGPAAHLAVAQGVPTVVLSGGGHPGRYFPWPHAPHAMVLNQRMPCDGCGGHCKLHEPECLTRVRPEDVVRACLIMADRERVRVAA